MSEKVLLLGNAAIARGAYEAGCQVAAAYPGTPSTEILETMAKDYRDIRSQWSPNEKTALETAMGAAVAGVRSIAAMKHVGLNVASDPLFTFSYTGINSGLVIINADDPGPWSSQNEQDNRHTARAAKVPMIEPSDPQEAKDFTKTAFDISEKFDVPVIVRITTRIAHSQGLVELEERISPVPEKEFVRKPEKHVMIPVFVRQRHKFKEEIQIPALKEYSETSGLNRIEWGRNRKRGIITDSVAYQYVKETCPDDSVLKIGMCWPMPDRIIKEFASQVDEICVVEELDPYIEEYVSGLGIKVSIGKKAGERKIPLLSELTPETVNEVLNGVKPKKTVPAYDPEKLPGRPPTLCAGCPHLYVFQVLKKLDLNVNGDIGCYTLGVLPPVSAMHTSGCMGASIGMHLGMEKARPQLARKSVAIIGDSTFIHSGITALIDMVYNKGTGTVIILDNRTTAMTGHQDHPATGKTLMGEETFALDFAALAKAAGVKRVVTVDPKNTEELERTVAEEVAAEEPSVIISLRKCILSK